MVAPTRAALYWRLRPPTARRRVLPTFCCGMYMRALLPRPKRSAAPLWMIRLTRYGTDADATWLLE